MPPRYQQGQLASPAVGTAGVDQTAGQAEQQIAQSLDRMSQSTAAQAMQQLGQAEQNFNQARGQFFYEAQRLEASRRRQEAIERAEAAEQREYQSKLDRFDEDDRLSGFVEGLKSQYAGDPDRAVAAFKSQLPSLQQRFSERYADPERLKLLTLDQRKAERTALHDLQGWARKTTNDNLEQRFALLPEQLGDRIDKLSGPIDEQLKTFDKHLYDVNNIYDGLRKKAVSQAAHDEILTKQLQMNQRATKRFADHLIAQTPEGEAGIGYLDIVGDIFSRPQDYGLPIASDDQKQLLEHLHSQKAVHEQEVITSVKSDSDLKLLDANRLKADLYNAANNPAALDAISKQVQGRFKDLDDAIARVSKEPDSKVKNAKLQGLKQEQNALISELGLDLKLVRSFDQLQRTLTTFARGQIRFAQGQQKFNQWVVDQQERADGKAAHEARLKASEAFNSDWLKAQSELRAAWSQPPGPGQQEAVSKIVKNYLPKLNQAVASGVIDAGAFGKYMDQLSGQLTSADLKRIAKPLQIGPFAIGGGETVLLKGREKQKAIEEAHSKFGEIVKSKQADLLSMQSAVEFLGTLTKGKGEKAILTQYVSANLPSIMENPRYKQATPQQQAALRAKWVRNKVAAFRRGELQ